MGAYSSFYTNACRLLSGINSGIRHKRASVKLPLSKVGFELSCALRNLGIIAGFNVGQRVSRVKGHSRLWDPRNSSISSSDEASGYPGMYITLYLNWDKHKPLYSKAQLAAAPVAAGSSSDAAPHAAHPGFTPPMGVNSPTPDHVKIISKPSHQRWISAQQLLRLRAASPPGIYLLSTHQGIITDIDAELRGVGGILLVHLGLPLGHVVQLRGLLRAKHDAEVAAAVERMQQHAAGVDMYNMPSTSSRLAAVPVNHAPLSQWDARQFAGDVAQSRLLLADGRQEAAEFLNALDVADQQRAELSRKAGHNLEQLHLQEMAWKQRQPEGHQGHDGHQGHSDRRSRRAAVSGRSRAAVGQ